MSLSQLPYKGETEKEDAIIRHINQIILGNLNNTDTVTLTESSTTTTVRNSRVSASSYIAFMPTTANAATEYAAGSMYVSSQTNGEFTITHANNSQTDRTFRYVHVG